MGRATKIEMYKKIIDAIASRSACSRRKLGAIIVKDDRIVATGYNGAPVAGKTAVTRCRVTRISTVYPRG